MLVALAVSLLAFQGATAQGINGNAAGFEIDNCGALFSGDGNTASPTCTGNKIIPCQPIALGDDWTTGTSHNGIFDGNGEPNIDPGTGLPYRALLSTDENWGNQSLDASDPDQFGGVSNKNIDAIGDPALDPSQEPWEWNGTGGGPQKNDLTNTYAFTKVDPATGHRWLYLAAETRSTNGDSHVDFEINLAGLKVCDSTGTICAPGGMGLPTGVTEGLIIGLGPDDGRTVDADFVVSLDFVTGGATPETSVHIWTETAPGVFEYVLVQDLGVDITNKIYTATNNCDILHNSGGSWTHFSSNGAPTPTMAGLQFVETAIDLTGLSIPVDPCGVGTTIQVKTRSSQSFTAELKDWELVSFPFEPTPECEITGPSLVCPGEEGIEYTVTETTGEVSPVEFEWTRLSSSGRSRATPRSAGAEPWPPARPCAWTRTWSATAASNWMLRSSDPSVPVPVRTRSLWTMTSHRRSPVRRTSRSSASRTCRIRTRTRFRRATTADRFPSVVRVIRRLANAQPSSPVSTRRLTSVTICRPAPRPLPSTTRPPRRSRVRRT